MISCDQLQLLKISLYGNRLRLQLVQIWPNNWTQLDLTSLVTSLVWLVCSCVSNPCKETLELFMHANNKYNLFFNIPLPMTFPFLSHSVHPLSQNSAIPPVASCLLTETKQLVASGVWRTSLRV